MLQVVPYPPIIHETPPQLQTSLITPLVGLPFPSSHNFREFDFSSQTMQLFLVDQMATENPSQNLPLVVTSVAAMVGPSSVAQQLMLTSVQPPMTMAAQQLGPSTSIPVGSMAQ